MDRLQLLLLSLLFLGTGGWAFVLWHTLHAWTGRRSLGWLGAGILAIVALWLAYWVVFPPKPGGGSDLVWIRAFVKGGQAALGLGILTAIGAASAEAPGWDRERAGALVVAGLVAAIALYLFWSMIVFILAISQLH